MGAGENAIAVSANGTTIKNEKGETLNEGTVLFESIPENIYYMKETDSPDGYSENSNTYVVIVGEGKLVKPANVSGTIWASNGVLGDITQQMINAQLAQYNLDKSFYRLSDDVQYAIFLIDSTTGKAVANPNIGRYGVMNSSERQNKTILRKVDSNNNSLSGASFEIHRYDGSLLRNKDSGSLNSTRFTSGVNGVYFIDILPYGTYYLHEVVVPSSMSQNGLEDWWYTLVIDENGTYVSTKQASSPF